LDFLQALDLP